MRYCLTDGNLVFFAERCNAGDKISNSVSKICVINFLKAFMRKVSILINGNLRKKIIADWFQTICFYCLVRINHVADCFTHFLSVRCNKTMYEHSFWQREFCRKKHGRPIDRMKPINIFSNNMKVSRPPFFPKRLIGSKTNAGYVNRERIKPYVHNLVWIVRNRYPNSLCTFFESGNTKIFKPVFNKSDDFRFFIFWRNFELVSLNEAQKRVLVFGKAEKIIFFRYFFRDFLMLWTGSIFYL